MVFLPPGDLEGRGERHESWTRLPAHQLVVELGQLVVGRDVLLLKREKRLGRPVDLTILAEDPPKILVWAAVSPALLLVLSRVTQIVNCQKLLR